MSIRSFKGMYLFGCVVLLGVVLVFLPYMGAPVVQFSEMDARIVTDKPFYTVGEVANVSVVVHNPGPRPVFVESFTYFFTLEQRSLGSVSDVFSGMTDEVEVWSRKDGVIQEVSLRVSGLGSMFIDFNGVNKTVRIVGDVDESIWTNPVEILDELPSNDFKYIPRHTWLGISQKLKQLNRTELPYLRAVLVDFYPDWANGEAVFLMTETGSEYVDPVLEHFTEGELEYIRVVKAPASRRHIWMWEMMFINHDKRLTEAGFQWCDMTIRGGKLIVGVVDAGPDKAEILHRVLPEIPTGIIVLYPSSPVMVA